MWKAIQAMVADDPHEVAVPHMRQHRTMLSTFVAKHLLHIIDSYVSELTVLRRKVIIERQHLMTLPCGEPRELAFEDATGHHLLSFVPEATATVLTEAPPSLRSLEAAPDATLAMPDEIFQVLDSEAEVFGSLGEPSLDAAPSRFPAPTQSDSQVAETCTELKALASIVALSDSQRAANASIEKRLSEAAPCSQTQLGDDPIEICDRNLGRKAMMYIGGKVHWVHPVSTPAPRSAPTAVKSCCPSPPEGLLPRRVSALKRPRGAL